MEPLVSVIIPIYKVESYLRECVDSVRSQIYQNLEIILVDDGSPDNCGAICDEYAATDQRVKVIHKVNGGQFDARNAGLDAANGDYISFIDSDDWIAHTLYSDIMHFHPFSMAVFGCTYVVPETDRRSTVKATEKTCRILTSDFEPIDHLARNSLLGYAANKIYSRKLLDASRFENIPFREDLLFNLNQLRKTDEILLSDACGYFYRQRGDSILHHGYSGTVPDTAYPLEQMLLGLPGFTEAQNRDLSNKLIKVYLTDLIGKCIVNNTALSVREKRQKISAVFNHSHVRKVLQFRKEDCSLYKLFTLCYKLHLSRLFLKVYARRCANG